MQSQDVKQKSRTAAQEYIAGDPDAARKELGELAFEALGEVFPEARQTYPRRRSGASPGFLLGMIAGAMVTFVALRRLQRRQR